MDDITKILTAVFGGVIVIAIASVVVSHKSQAPQAIQAIGSSIGNIVAAAVNPVSANYGYGNGASPFSLPSSGNIVSELAPNFSSSAIFPGALK